MGCHVAVKSHPPGIEGFDPQYFSEDHYGLRLIKAGASGYLTKSSAPDQLIRAIRKVASGGKFISPSLAEKLIEVMDHDMDKSPHERLSEREFQVFCLIATGRRMKKIAEELSVSITTVSTHRANILEKMELNNNAELIRYALNNGILPEDPSPRRST